MANLEAHFDTLSKKWNLPSTKQSQVLLTLRHAVHLQEALISLMDRFKIFVKQFLTTTSAISSRLKTRHENSTATPPSRHESTKSIFHLLRQWFLLLLRLRDSQTYLQSGEARHPGDIHFSCSTRYRSLLKTKGVQSDGYTSYFKSDHYSGTGWDEYFDDRVGLRVRLKRILGEGKVDKLMERSYFEAKFDTWDEDYKKYSGKIEETVEGLMEDCRRYLGRVEFVGKDKEEKLKVTVKADQLILHRLGDDYRIEDKGGVLPEGFGKKEWKAVTRVADIKGYEGEGGKRKRVVLEDSEDEDKEGTGGGGIKVVAKKIEKVKEGSSLERIKREVGVGIETTGEDIGREERGEEVWEKVEAEVEVEVDVDVLVDMEVDEVEDGVGKREFLAWGDELLVVVVN
ncbi:hypothetical protein TrVE_jg8620 [Triparma verrucosa]|uniref:Uncharacterized protein n=1 Tax=Triparma verrucosa TaxID=1606542 RepID=A0A9W7FGG5_9STRA|nr:hypothetical protein TrVE_jg8620 [Triparma verrucosa]